MPSDKDLTKEILAKWDDGVAYFAAWEVLTVCAGADTCTKSGERLATSLARFLINALLPVVLSEAHEHKLRRKENLTDTRRHQRHLLGFMVDGSLNKLVDFAVDNPNWMFEVRGDEAHWATESEAKRSSSEEQKNRQALREHKVKPEPTSANDHPLGDFSWPDQNDRKGGVQHELVSLFSVERFADPDSTSVKTTNRGLCEQTLDELRFMRARMGKMEDKLMAIGY
jgi:hypothetical protein